jgi:hypothetical protein
MKHPRSEMHFNARSLIVHTLHAVHLTSYEQSLTLVFILIKQDYNSFSIRAKGSCSRGQQSSSSKSAMLLSRSPHSRQLLATCLFRAPHGSSSHHFIVSAERRISSSVPRILAAAAWANSGNAAATDRVLGVQIMRMFSSSSPKREKDEGEITIEAVLKPRRWITPKKPSKALGEKGSKWSAEEDEKLIMLHESGLPWAQVADHFAGRTVGSCKYRYRNHLFEGEKRIQISWSAEDSLKLKELKDNSDMSWVQIAAHFEGRAVGSCKYRYRNYLFEGEEQIRWSDEESLKLKELKEMSDMSWAQITAHFEGRTVEACKKRYGNALFEGEKQIRLPWSDEDSLKLKELKEETDMSWAQIADRFKGRTDRACVARYGGVLFEGEKQIRWSDEDSLKLKELKEESDMSWAQIAAHFEGRTVGSCEKRYSRALLEEEE